MTKRKSHPKSVPVRRSANRNALALACTLLALPLAGEAAITDISTVPLASSSTAVVKPNILFTLDDSGSMAWGHMPDSIDNWAPNVGYKNHLCNSMYYNPATNYAAPKNADGTNFTDANFAAARYNGFAAPPVPPATDTRDLTSNYIAYDNTTSSGNGTDTAQAAYYYKWTPNTVTTPAASDCTAANSNALAAHTVTVGTRGTWTKVLVSATSGPGSTDERTNFANWYSYYRTRILMMKSATGRAFAGINSAYRVGFITINPGSPVGSGKYLAISDFTTTQKSDWYTKLYSQTTGSSTPLRTALSRAGRHYAGKQDGINSGMTGDPVQYSCQQNFTILTTDGFWNGGNGLELDGTTTMGNYDGNISTTPRPLFDGSVSVTTSTTTTVTESTTTFGCGGGDKRLRTVTTVVTTPVSPSGPATTSTTTKDGKCTNKKITLQSPNPDVSTKVTTNITGGAANTLADVAAYYYLTDLRPAGSIGALGTDVGTDNNVPSGGTTVESDSAKHQHMTTFTMGLGLSGTLNFQPDYKTGTGDFTALRDGTKNWPAPKADDATALDDLWHAAVNGRGDFFSAANPDTVVSSLSAALAGVNARVASAAAAATSNLEPVAGDNFAYTASYKTLEWIGELEAKEINLVTGAVSTTAVWSAQAKLNSKVNQACDNRVIKVFRDSATGKLGDFTWNTFKCDKTGAPTGSPLTGLNASEQGNFGKTAVADFTQYADMTDGTGGTVDQRTAAQDANLVNFLRGQRGLETFLPNDLTALYRSRTAVLGDIVNAQPVFAKKPFAEYKDDGYDAFKAGPASTRDPMVYVAANDGMLHAFYAGADTKDPLGGEERWAFIPTMVLPTMYKLADNKYSNLHQYSVDGTPVIGDVYDAVNKVWKTILVGGMNSGGRGYYALDITDPDATKVQGLWEFKHSTTCLSPVAGQSADCHLGLTYGNPIITKLPVGHPQAGTWVVIVSSGYNNVNSPAVTGDGLGYFYVLDAITGKIIEKHATTAGDATTPSGLGKINGFVLDTIKDNSTTHVYGADLQGNVWRVNLVAGKVDLLTTVVDASGTAQPITTRPEIAEFTTGTTTIFVATGSYLGASDLKATSTQTVWAIPDINNASATISKPRTAFKELTIKDSGATRSITCTNNCGATGWFADLPTSGERVNVDMKFQLGTLTVASNVPQNNACNIGGFSFLNFFDAKTGLQVAGSANFSSKLSDSLAVGINVVRLPDGRTVVIATTSDASQQTAEAPIPPGIPQGRRTSWRELVQ